MSETKRMIPGQTMAVSIDDAMSDFVNVRVLNLEEECKIADAYREVCRIEKEGEPQEKLGVFATLSELLDLVLADKADPKRAKLQSRNATHIMIQVLTGARLTEEQLKKLELPH